MLPSAPTPYTTRSGFAAWFRDSRRRHGFWRSFASLLGSICELVRDYAPSRRRLRYGDIDYDCEYRVDTTWANVSLGTRLREIFAGRQYQPTDPELFRAVISELDICHDEFTFIDLGSGKGRALLLASEFPFRRIIGVELLPELHAIARQNAGRYQGAAQQSRIELWCGDAREFEFPPEPSVVFLFDPFPEHILEQVMTKLERSVRRLQRRVLLVYQNPISEHVLSNARWLRRLRGNVQYAVYESVLPS